VAVAGYRNGLNCSLVLYSGAPDAVVSVALWQFLVGSYDGIVAKDGASDAEPVLRQMSGSWHIDTPIT
jgi:hypothetical protein